MNFHSKCIWCRASPASSLEHIVPEALGCPPNFVLRFGVCHKCNLANSKLDRALLKPFELITVIRGISRKRGKLPTIDGYSTVASSYGQSGPEIFINRETFSVEIPSGKRLGPTSKTDHFHDVTWEELPNGQVRCGMKQRLQFDRNAVRGLFKIALESIAYYQGLDVALDVQFDGIRHFVLRNESCYSAVMTGGEPYDTYISQPYAKDNRPYIVGMSILQIGFLCDFDPTFAGGKELMAAASVNGIGSFQLPN